MPKLTDNDLLILGRASERDDRAVILPPHLRGAVAKGIISRLAGGGLIIEVAAEAPYPVWRRDDDGVAFALMVTDDGLRAIGVEVDTALEAPGTKPEGETGDIARGAEAPDEEAEEQSSISMRSGSKHAAVIAHLRRQGGATIEALTSLTGWQPHSTRAALSGLRKKGFSIERQRPNGGAASYRIVSEPAVLKGRSDGPQAPSAKGHRAHAAHPPISRNKR